MANLTIDDTICGMGDNKPNHSQFRKEIGNYVCCDSRVCIYQTSYKNLNLCQFANISVLDKFEMVNDKYLLN